MTEGEGREIPHIPLSRINSEGKLEYTDQVLDAFDAKIKAYPESPSAGDITLVDRERLFVVEAKSRGDDKLWTRTYYSPRLSSNPDDLIKLEPNLAISLFKGFWRSGLAAYYYPENSFNPPQKVKLGTKGAIEKAEVELFLKDHLSVTWGVDGIVGKIGLEGEDFKNLGVMRRDDLNQLYNNEADRVTVSPYDDPSVQLEASLGMHDNLLVKSIGGGARDGYQIKSHLTPLDHTTIVSKMATEELLENPGTAPVTEDIWKGIDISSTFGIKVLPQGNSQQ